MRIIGPATLLAAVLTLSAAAIADELPWPEAETIQSDLYFGMHSADGAGVSEQAWQGFLADTITPHFPDGLTVIEAYGQVRPAAGPQAGELVREPTRLVIIVHPNTAEAQEALAEIKEDFRASFGQPPVFHVDSPVRIVE